MENSKDKNRMRLAVCSAALLLSANAAHANVVISSKPTVNMTCSGGICTPTAKKAVLNVDDLAAMLANGDTAVQSGSVAQDIEVDAVLSWTSTRRLALDSYRSIAFNKPVEVAGVGALTITTNDGGSGGDFQFRGKGHVEFWDTTSVLIINSKSYALVSDIASLGTDISSDPSGAYALAKSHNAKHDGVFDNSVVVTPFSGVFEGLGNEISNLTMVTTSSVSGGFFGKVAQGGVLRDVSITHSAIKAAYPHSAAALLAGEVWGQVIHTYVSGNVSAIGNDSGCGAGLVGGIEGGTILDSHADVAVNVHSRNKLAGGLVCLNTGTITDCYATGAVSYWGGGLVGQNSGSIIGSYATGAVFSGGGLVGRNFFGIIYRSYATGAIRQNGGGLVDTNFGEIWQSFATGAVNGNLIDKHHPGIAGGLIGTAETGEITDSYATGGVSGGSDTTEKNGGLIGLNYAYADGTAMDTSYAIGLVVGPGYDGGVIGYDAEQTSKREIFWDLDTSSINNTSQGAGQPANDLGLAGLTDTQLKTALPVGFDPKIWRQASTINNGYPYLIDNPPPR